MSKRFIPTDEQVARAQKLWVDEKLQGLMRKCIRINAGRLVGKLQPHAQRDELEQAGWMGAWIGACRYRPSRGTKPFTYIHVCICGYMQKYMKDIARERGCPSPRWERRQFVEHEFPLAEPEIQERALSLDDGAAATRLADALDGDWRSFRNKLPQGQREALDGLLRGLTAAEMGKSSQSVTNQRAVLREKWVAFVAAREERERCAA